MWLPSLLSPPPPLPQATWKVIVTKPLGTGWQVDSTPALSSSESSRTGQRNRWLGAHWYGLGTWELDDSLTPLWCHSRCGIGGTQSRPHSRTRVLMHADPRDWLSDASVFEPAPVWTHAIAVHCGEVATPSLLSPIVSISLWTQAPVGLSLTPFVWLSDRWLHAAGPSRREIEMVIHCIKSPARTRNLVCST